MIAVIGCGNTNRSDDGAGSEVIRLLRLQHSQTSIQQLRLLDAGTDGMLVMFAARGCKRLILVDACRMGIDPGAIFEVPGSALESCHIPSFTLHDFRWEHALFAGKKIFGENFPEDVTAFLIESETVKYGVGLSSRVRAAVEAVASRIGVILAPHIHQNGEP